MSKEEIIIKIGKTVLINDAVKLLEDYTASKDARIAQLETENQMLFDKINELER